MKTLVAQSCPTLCNPMDCSLPGSSVHGILPARISNWVPFPGDLHDPGIEPRSPALQAASLPAEILGKPQYTVLERKYLFNLLNAKQFQSYCYADLKKTHNDFVFVDFSAPS